MPNWFIVLGKVLSMLARLVPMVEEQVAPAPGAGAEKKAAVLGKVTDYIERGPDGADPLKLSQEERGVIVALAAPAVDAIVAAANDAGVFRHREAGGSGPESGHSMRSGGRRGAR